MDATVLVVLFIPLTWPIILVHRRDLFTLLFGFLYTSEAVLNDSEILLWRKLKSPKESSRTTHRSTR